MSGILFITPAATPKLKEEVLGTWLLATILRRSGLDCRILRYYEIGDVEENYQAFIRKSVSAVSHIAPKILGFYTMGSNYHIALRMAQQVKERHPGIVTVFGGPHASVVAAETLRSFPFVDYVCCGEGENTVVPFFTAILKKEPIDNIPGLVYRRDGEIRQNPLAPFIDDLDTLPYMDPSLLPDHYEQISGYMPSKTGHDFFFIDAGRGCPFNCYFCATSNFWHRHFRMKSPRRLVDEIKYSQQLYGATQFGLGHDMFTASKQRIYEFCDLLEKEQLSINWYCAARIDTVDEEELSRMIDCGMSAIEFGIETGSPRMQKIIHKNLKLDRAEEIIRFLRNKGTQITAFFMYGFPEETEEDLNQTLALQFRLMELGCHCTMYRCQFHPGTELTEKHLTELVPDTDKNAYWGTSGSSARQEEDMFLANRAVFPFVFEYHTPLRDRTKHLSFFVRVYQSNLYVTKYIREFYKPENLLDFYFDFISCNQEFFAKVAAHGLTYDKLEMLRLFGGLLKKFEGDPVIPRLRELIRFYSTLHDTAKDGVWREEFAFDLAEVKAGLPPRQFSNALSIVRFTRKNGRLTYRVEHTMKLDP